MRTAIVFEGGLSSDKYVKLSYHHATIVFGILHVSPVETHGLYWVKIWILPHSFFIIPGTDGVI